MEKIILTSALEGNYGCFSTLGILVADLDDDWHHDDAMSVPPDVGHSLGAWSWLNVPSPFSPQVRLYRTILTHPVPY